MFVSNESERLLPDQQTLEDINMFDSDDELCSFAEGAGFDEPTFDSPESAAHWMEGASHRFTVA